MTPYEFAAIRYLHSYSTGEAINVGLVLWSFEQRRFIFFLNQRYGRLSSIFRSFDGKAYRGLIRELQYRFDNYGRELEARQCELIERKRASLGDYLPDLVPLDSSCFQWSDVMTGIASDIDARFVQLRDEFVTGNEKLSSDERQNEEAIWRSVEPKLEQLASRYEGAIAEREVGGERYSYRFRASWMNGKTQVLEPVSFDYQRKSEILEKATIWTGRLVHLAKESDTEFEMTAIVCGPSSNPDLVPIYNDAVSMLNEAPCIRGTTELDELSSFVELMIKDIEPHY